MTNDEIKRDLRDVEKKMYDLEMAKNEASKRINELKTEKKMLGVDYYFLKILTNFVTLDRSRTGLSPHRSDNTKFDGRAAAAQRPTDGCGEAGEAGRWTTLYQIQFY
jgi:hypothetical protein